MFSLKILENSYEIQPLRICLSLEVGLARPGHSAIHVTTGGSNSDMHNLTTELSSFCLEMNGNGLLEKYCPNPSCFIWDGFGTWVAKVWKPYVSGMIRKFSRSPE